MKIPDHFPSNVVQAVKVTLAIDLVTQIVSCPRGYTYSAKDERAATFLYHLQNVARGLILDLHGVPHNQGRSDPNLIITRSLDRTIFVSPAKHSGT